MFCLRGMEHAGKLDCYVAAAGFHPQRVLPVVVDVGTNNEALRNDPLYMGLRQDRITGDEYYEVGSHSKHNRLVATRALPSAHMHQSQGPILPALLHS